MKKITFVVLAVIMVVALIAGALSAQTVKKAKAKVNPAAESTIAAVYSCPMHPEVIADKPGKCPKCGMFLEKKDVPVKAAASACYSCPMHPEVTSDKPGKCPKCGMNLAQCDTQKTKSGAVMDCCK